MFLIVAAVSTYYTYCLYKDSTQANQAFSDIKDEYIQKNINWLEYYQKRPAMRSNKTICEEKFFLASGVTLCSYLTFWVYALYAYMLDPNRNNKFLLKYQQCLKLVELIQEIQS